MKAATGERVPPGQPARDGDPPREETDTDSDAGPSTPEVLTGSWRTVAAVLFVAVVALGVALRFWTHSALWLDEALTVNIARLPLHHLPGALKRDGAPPLYYVLLHFWIRAFGASDLAVRSLSGVLSVATLPLAWLAARRYGGRTAAWVVLVLLACAPFAIYYGTEARMYSLVMLLTTCGVLALDRALRAPRVGNLVAVAVVTAGLLYSQYWSLYLVGTVGLWLAWVGWRGPGTRRAHSRWALGAVVAGCVAFVPWLPTFAFQARHTGTPWAAPANFSAIINAVTGFTDNQATVGAGGTNQGRLLALLYFLLAFLGVFGIARDRFHISLDIRTRRRPRAAAFVVLVTLAVAVSGGLITKSAFTPRYASVVFVPLLLLIGLGALTFLDARLRAVVVGVGVAAGLVLGVQNITTARTQAPGVAAVLAAHAHAGDVVAFCPDQLGPAVDRLLPAGRFETSTFPRRTSPRYVDWVDYKAVVRATHVAAYARALERAAGSTHQIWLVWAPGYQGFAAKCEDLAATLLHTPGYGGHQWVTTNPAKYYEPMTLVQYAPPRR